MDNGTWVNVELCVDCVTLAVNGEDNQFESETDRATALEMLRQMPMLTVETNQDGFFSKRRCDCCDSRLGELRVRYDAAYWTTAIPLDVI